MLPTPLHNGSFRVVPMGLPEEEIEVFLAGLQDFEINMATRHFGLSVLQLESAQSLGAVWRVLNEKISFQIDAYANKGGTTIFSIVALDCEAIDHNFAMSFTDNSRVCTHRISFKYREHLRLGANGSLADGKEDIVSDADRMLTKLTFRQQND